MHARGETRSKPCDACVNELNGNRRNKVHAHGPLGVRRSLSPRGDVRYILYQVCERTHQARLPKTQGYPAS